MFRRALLAVPVVLLGASSVLADTIVLKNGRRVDGKILIDNDREVTIRTRGGVLLSFARRTVASIEREAQPGAAPLKTAVEEDLMVPLGATDDEIQRLRALVPQLREVARRYVEARRDREGAEKEGAAGADRARLAEGREKEFQRQLDQLKAAREAIDRSAAARLQAAARAAKVEADGLRADTDKLRGAKDATGLADRAVNLRARAPQDPRDPRHAALVGEALRARELAAEVDLQGARGAKTLEARVAALVRAAESYAWCGEVATGAARAAARKKAVETYEAAHRAVGFRALVSGVRDDHAPIEKALQNLHAFKACAALVDDRLGERRWGPELKESEAGQYRMTLDDGRVVYAPDLPATAFARSAQERRERTEQRVQKDASGSRTTLVKVTRWYELTWDAAKKRWARESQATQLEVQRVIPLLRSTQELADALARCVAEQEKAEAAVAARREALLLARRRVEQAEATEESLEVDARELASATKARDAAVEATTRAQAALAARRNELAELDKELERAKKGE